MNRIDEVRHYYRALLPYYDRSLEDRGDLPFWEAMARRWNSKSILELGCGTGRVTEVLVRHAPVTAVDLLMEMLTIASRKAPDAGFIAADLGRLPLRGQFDLILLADDPMAHMIETAERREVLHSIAFHLAAQGRMLIEGLYRPGREQAGGDGRNAHEGHSRSFEAEEAWEPMDSSGTVWRATYRFSSSSGTAEATALLRSWNLADVEWLAEAGLEIESLWGDFDERPFTESAARMLIVARRML